MIWRSGNGGIQTFYDQIEDFVNGGKLPRFNPHFIPKIIAGIISGIIIIR